MSYLVGIDVSHHQGVIDWDRVAAAGIAYAFIRCSDGVTKDREFDRNWHESQRVGLVRGCYHYFRARHELPTSQVEHLREGELPPVLYFETLDGMDDVVATNRARTWANQAERICNQLPIFYSYPHFIATSIHAPRRFDDSPLWIAHYGVDDPTVPKQWTDWTFWQYTDSGTVDGIATPVDLNRFRGTMFDLGRFAQRCTDP